MDNFTITAEDELLKKKDGFSGEHVCVLPSYLKHVLEKSRLCKNLFLTDIGLYPAARYHNRERPQGCEQFILIYCLSGAGWFSVLGKRYPVKPNQFFILPPRIGHKYGADPRDPWTIHWVHFTGELAADYFYHLIGKNSFEPRTVIPSEERNQLFERIIRYVSMIKNPDAVTYANNCLYSYLSSFKNSIFTSPDHETNDIVESCIKLMRENIDKNLNLFEIAQMMDVSISYLSSLFKEKVHDSPYNYYIFLKTQRACYLLWNTTLNVKAIAAQLGYDDPYHFSRLFKNVMGLSPRQFRNRDK